MMTIIGDKLGEVSSESLDGSAALSPVFVQIFVTPDTEMTSYSTIQPSALLGLPLFCTPAEWKIYECMSFDPILFFTGGSLSRHKLHKQQQQLALQKRQAFVSACQEHYYQLPPQIERGYQQYLYDCNGRGYLDMVNNVAIVGHSHPKIAERAYHQLLQLNTNSRFLYQALGDYGEKILEHIPERFRVNGKLNRVFFVNSGSEATDLALRIARTVVSERRMKSKDHRKKDQLYELCRDVLCIQGGYHGVTTASDEISTTLNDNPRSLETRAPWIHLVPMPNYYRGIYRLPEDEVTEENLERLAAQYAGNVLF